MVRGDEDAGCCRHYRDGKQQLGVRTFRARNGQFDATRDGIGAAGDKRIVEGGATAGGQRGGTVGRDLDTSGRAADDSLKAGQEGIAQIGQCELPGRLPVRG